MLCGVGGNGDRDKIKLCLPTLLNAYFLISVQHPGAIIPHLVSLVPVKLFLCMDSCLNCCFSKGISSGKSYSTSCCHPHSAI